MLRTLSKAYTICALAFAASPVFRAGATASQAVRLEPLQEQGTVLARPLIPKAFRGHWSVDPHDCSDPPIDNSQVWIATGTLNYYETNGRVFRVVSQDRRHAVVTVAADGEGISFTAKKGLTLSSDLQLLTIRDEDDTGQQVYRRCPVAYN